MKASKQHTTRVSCLIAAAALCGSLLGPTTAANAQASGPIREEVGVGFFYGTFDEDPNMVLLVGGTAEEFCEDSPDDPFNGEPGSATSRTFVRDSGRVDIKINDRRQPIYLYEQPEPSAPEWISRVCNDFFDNDASTVVPEPIARGYAKLKVRISILDESLVDVFNSVNGNVVASNGTRYRVRASADLIVRDGIPVGDPTDFVRLRIRQIGH